LFRVFSVSAGHFSVSAAHVSYGQGPAKYAWQGKVVYGRPVYVAASLSNLFAWNMFENNKVNTVKKYVLPKYSRLIFAANRKCRCTDIGAPLMCAKYLKTGRAVQPLRATRNQPESIRTVPQEPLFPTFF